MTRLGIADILTAGLLVACSPPAPTFVHTAAPTTSVAATPAPATAAPLTPGPSSTLDRTAGWRADLTTLLPAMDRVHPDLAHGTSREALDTAVDDLVSTIPTATDDELMVGVLRVVAMVSADGCDGHTGAFIWGAGTYPVDSLPLRLWLFGDDVVVVDALAPFEDIVGSRIDSIEGRPITDVIAAIRPLVPKDNDQTVRLLLPRYLLIPQVLRGLGLADAGDIELGLTALPVSRSTVEVAPIAMADYNAWAGPYGLHLPADPNVPYLARMDDALWWQVLADGETLSVHYNRVDPQPRALLDNLGQFLRGPGLERIVLDLRHNYGGEVPALVPILDLLDDPAVDQPGRFDVITGRNTFSAASLLVARLDDATDATIVGEPMGGCPTAYGDASDVTLPFSGIVVSVAGTLEVGVAADDDRKTIEPDRPVELTLDEWQDGTDPAMRLITSRAP